MLFQSKTIRLSPPYGSPCGGFAVLFWRDNKFGRFSGRRCRFFTVLGKAGDNLSGPDHPGARISPFKGGQLVRRLRICHVIPFLCQEYLSWPFQSHLNTLPLYPQGVCEQ